jgi:methyl-accepting chemotaxis protein
MLSFAVMLALIAGIATLAIASLSGANSRVQVLYQDDIQGLSNVDDMLLARTSMAKPNRDAILNISDPEKVAAAEKATKAAIAEFHANLQEADKHFYTPEGRAFLDKMRKGLPAYEQANSELMKRVGAKDLKGAKAALTAVSETGKVLTEAGEGARKFKTSLAAEKFRLNNQQFQSSRALILGAAGVSLALAVLLSLMLASGFAVPLQQAVVALEKVAAGDLTATLDVHTKDEMGRMAVALNAALTKLRSTLQTVSESASATSASSEELAAAAKDIAAGSQEQAASLEETSASLEEITATVRQSADNSRQANQLAASSRETAESGQQVVANAVAAMEDINVSSAKISDIISTIDEIAFQTNLLAVNAAVEAARAGEQGRGFAVVAAEVRSLAQRSAGAAKEIKSLIQDTLKKVERGTELVNKSGETLQTIVSSVKRVTDIVAEISAAAEEQSTGINQVNIAVTQIDQVTQSNSAQTEEMSSTAQILSDQSLRLTRLVGVFKLTDGSEEALPASVDRPSMAGRVQRPTARPRPVKAAIPLRPALALATADADSSFEEF